MSNSSQPIPTLSRLTTAYVPEEDRVRVSGLRSDNSTTVIWLTQRLLNRIIPVLADWLENLESDLPRADLLHSIKQDRAVARHGQRIQQGEETPVVADATASTWLAISVDIQPRQEHINLVFKDRTSEPLNTAALVLHPDALRQWLNIVLTACRQAQWPLDAWPDWMLAHRATTQTPLRRQLH